MAERPRRVPRSLLIVLAAAVALAACGAPAPPGPAEPAAPAPTAPAGPTGPAPDADDGTDNGTENGAGTDTGNGTDTDGHQFLWPFADAEQARRWQVEAAPQGHQPWHSDAEFTALAFTQGFLGFAELDQVTSSSQEGDEAWIGVGAAQPGGPPSTAAVVHLVRLGTGPDAPWEVVGTRDDSLVLDTPRYGSAVTSPITAGGTITGVDESLRLQVRQIDRDGVLGEHCCPSAGGTGARWTAQVPFEGAGNGALTLVVSTGGHVADVERFAVTGLQVGK